LCIGGIYNKYILLLLCKGENGGKVQPMEKKLPLVRVRMDFSIVAFPYRIDVCGVEVFIIDKFSSGNTTQNYGYSVKKT
jgi:hypothetical protein